LLFAVLIALRHKRLRSIEATDMHIWHRFVLLFFPGSLEEYQESRQIHLVEMRRYRKQPQFIAGIVLFAGSLLYLLLAASARDDWVTMLLIVCLSIGMVCIHDTISEHYCLLLHRLGYGKQAFPDSLGETGFDKQ
jgi:uncharacterized membrane protein YgdD (TMEM256/DUF423 family)